MEEVKKKGHRKERRWKTGIEKENGGSGRGRWKK